MENLKRLQTFFFGNGEAEAEVDVLREVFVTPDNIEPLLDFNSSPYKVLLGPKGIGKTILLNAINNDLLFKNKLSLIIQPSDINCDSIAQKDTHASKIKEAHKQILVAIAAELGRKINFAVSDKASNLVKISQKLGDKRFDALQRLKEFLTEIVPADYEKLIHALSNVQQIDERTAIVKQDVTEFLKGKEINFVLLLDNIDQALIEKSPTHDYSTIWALIHAATKISNEAKIIRCIISVRLDIWHIMVKWKKLGTDIVDKMPVPFELSMNEQMIERILLKRIDAASFLVPKENRNSNPILNFFAEERIQLPGKAGETRSWARWIAKNSRNKPRDMVQLINALIDEALKKKSDRITSQHAKEIMLQFAIKRLDNIDSEFGKICPQIREIINDLCTDTRFEFEKLITILKSAPSRHSIQIDGFSLAPDSINSAARILYILHMANFMNPRVEDLTKPDKFNHILYEHNKDYVRPERMDQMKKDVFEIHPVFHEYVAKMRGKQ